MQRRRVRGRKGKGGKIPPCALSCLVLPYLAAAALQQLERIER